MEKEIIWTENALNQLEEIYFYLLDKTKNESIPEKVINTIYDSVSILKSNFEIYELDEMKSLMTEIIELTKFTIIEFHTK